MREKGFTLIEILIVVIILGTLASIAIPLYSGMVEKAKIIKIVQQISNVERVYLEDYFLEHDINTDTQQQLRDALCAGQGAIHDNWEPPDGFTLGSFGSQSGLVYEYKTYVYVNKYGTGEDDWLFCRVWRLDESGFSKR